MKTALAIFPAMPWGTLSGGWHRGGKRGMRTPMTSDPSNPNDRKPANPVGAGAPLAFLIIAGVIVGGLLGQPSIGLLVGAGLGIAIAIIAWRSGQRK